MFIREEGVEGGLFLGEVGHGCEIDGLCVSEVV